LAAEAFANEAGRRGPQGEEAVSLLSLNYHLSTINCDQAEIFRLQFFDL
jgi:hypothetical protein